MTMQNPDLPLPLGEGRGEGPGTDIQTYNRIAMKFQKTLNIWVVLLVGLTSAAWAADCQVSGPLSGNYLCQGNILTANPCSVAASASASFEAWYNVHISKTFSVQSGAGFTVKRVDDDGLPNDWELQYLGTLEYGIDSDPDGDKIVNGWEYLLGFNPSVNDGDAGRNADADSDGFSNYLEILFGGDPVDPNALPGIPGRGIFYEYDERGRIQTIIRAE